jgi:hypothetical protein
VSRRKPITRPSERPYSKVRGPSINELWLTACADTDTEPGNATEATRLRYRHLLQLHGINAERPNG